MRGVTQIAWCVRDGHYTIRRKVRLLLVGNTKGIAFEAGKHAKQTWQGIIVLVLPWSEAF